MIQSVKKRDNFKSNGCIKITENYSPMQNSNAIIRTLTLFILERSYIKAISFILLCSQRCIVAQHVTQ